jgi:hypothetical protein
VRKRKEKTERIKRKKVVRQGYIGRQINKEDGSWTTQQAKKAIGRCFGAPHGKKERQIGETLKSGSS